MRRQPIFLIVFLLGIISGCVESTAHRVYPVTTGSHAPGEGFAYGFRNPSMHATPTQPGTYVVWANHSGVEHYLAGQLLEYGYIVVERARLQRILDEQNLRISLAATSNQLTEEILKAGKVAGATHVIFADVRPQSQLHTASVAIRSVQVDTGQVRWSGTAHLGQPVAEPDGGVIMLAYWAMNRATCQVEDGWMWRDPTEGMTGGCIEQDWHKAKREQYQWLMTEMQWLQTEKSTLDQQKLALDKERDIINAEMDLQKRQQMLPEYTRKLDEYTKRLVTYDQRVKVYNERNTDLGTDLKR